MYENLIFEIWTHKWNTEIKFTGEKLNLRGIKFWGWKKKMSQILTSLSHRCDACIIFLSYKNEENILHFTNKISKEIEFLPNMRQCSKNLRNKIEHWTIFPSPVQKSWWDKNNTTTKFENEHYSYRILFIVEQFKIVNRQLDNAKFGLYFWKDFFYI